MGDDDKGIDQFWLYPLLSIPFRSWNSLKFGLKNPVVTWVQQLMILEPSISHSWEFCCSSNWLLCDCKIERPYMCYLYIKTNCKLHRKTIIMALQTRQKWTPAIMQEHFPTLWEFWNGKQVCIGGGFVSLGHCDRVWIHQAREKLIQAMKQIGHDLSAIGTKGEFYQARVWTGQEMARV